MMRAALIVLLLIPTFLRAEDPTEQPPHAPNDVSSLIPEARDTDGDGIADIYEKQAGSNYLDPRSVPLDMDQDGIPDRIDDDTDGDGVPNHRDAFPLIRLEWSDIDGDGLGDNIDSDRDNDGINNDYELEVGTDPNDAASVPPDGDRDLIPDSLDDDWDNDGSINEIDAFPYDPSEWRDLDGDGIGDHVDTDLDDDGIINDYELQLGTDPRFNGSVPADLDGDGLPDQIDPDRDNDGYDNHSDAFPDDPQEWVDLDHDGIGDQGDNDLDGDGYDNRQEQGSGTNERDSDDFPDHTPPEVSYLEWDIARPSLSGMAYDAGIGLQRIWIENDAGDECEAVILYAGHFLIECPELNPDIDWRLRAVDEKGNLTRLIIRAVNKQDTHADRTEFGSDP